MGMGGWEETPRVKMGGPARGGEGTLVVRMRNLMGGWEGGGWVGDSRTQNRD